MSSQYTNPSMENKNCDINQKIAEGQSVMFTINKKETKSGKQQ